MPSHRAAIAAPPPPLHGLVLAGGRSLRMGQDKAALRWQGRSLLEHGLDLLREAGASERRISGPQDIADRYPQLGPVGGLASAVEQLPDGRLLVLAIDMPRVDLALLRTLLEAPEAASVHFDGNPLPLRMHLDARARQIIHDQLGEHSRQRSLQALLVRLGGVTLALDADVESRLRNCNTPEEWSALCRES